MRNRGVVAITLLVLGAFLDRFAYYGHRSIEPLALSREGHLTMAEIGSALSFSTWAGAFAALVAGAIAIAVGPRVTAAAGAVASAVGFALFGAGAPPLLSLALVGIGSGAFYASVWAAAADVVLRDANPPGWPPAGNRFAMTAGIATILYGAMNAGSLFAGPMFSSFVARQGFGTVSFAAAGCASVEALLLGGAAFAARAGDPRSAAPSPEGPYRTAVAPAAARGPAIDTTKALLGVALLAGVACILSAAFDLGTISISGSYRFAELRLLQAVNPATVVAGAFFVSGVWVAATFDRWSLPPLALAGVGVAVVGVSALLAPFHENAVAYAASSFLGGGGEILAMPVLYAYAALALPRKYAALVMGGFIFVTRIAFAITAALSAAEAAVVPLVVVAGLALIASGIAGSALARRMHRAFFDPPRAA